MTNEEIDNMSLSELHEAINKLQAHHKCKIKDIDCLRDVIKEYISNIPENIQNDVKKLNTSTLEKNS